VAKRGKDFDQSLVATIEGSMGPMWVEGDQGALQAGLPWLRSFREGVWDTGVQYGQLCPELGIGCGGERCEECTGPPGRCIRINPLNNHCKAWKL
jgi:hypothetical protein